MNESVCSSKQKWNQDECRCECKDLADWGCCKIDYIWIPSMCDCECNKACKVNQYLDIKQCSCKKLLTEKLMLEREDEISNTIETSLNNKRSRCKK